MTLDLEQHYLAYLAALNERRFDDLADHVADELTYNDEPMTLADYRAARRGEAELIPDLRFVATKLVVQAGSSGDTVAGTVAAVLRFECTPTGPFLGLDFGGRTVDFTEHVFYDFDGPLITRVLSLLDVAALHRQADRH